MLTSIAAIATAISGLIAVYIKISASIKAAREEKRIEDGRSIEKQISEAKTDEERAELARKLSNHSTH